MTNITPERLAENDWYKQPIAPNVFWKDGFYCETAQSFRFMRSKLERAVEIGENVSVYSGCSFAIGVNGSCSVGDYSLLNGAIIMAEERIEIGSHCLISWNVGIADSDFHPIDPAARRIDAMALSPFAKDRPERPPITIRPVRIGDNVWIGMGAIILKGVTIGENSVIAAGAVVTKDVPANVVVAGNPGVVVKELKK